jgi:peptidoglycan/LPS O-acetylase OafA/YrhL
MRSEAAWDHSAAALYQDADTDIPRVGRRPQDALAPGKTGDQARPVPRQNYRADIDGLRALAVAAVILAHAGSLLSGGYLGVDVFFVISGYLIHRDLSSRFHAGTFSVREFLSRRIRRTLPALYLVTFVCVGAAAFVLLPGDFDALARSAAAACLSISNILFLTQTGYFDHEAITKPLLHTWSLGVEEQFYFVAPLLSFCLFRMTRRIRSVAYFGLVIGGLIFCAVLQATAPAAAFFLMPARLWEFLIGCAIADGVIPSIRRRWLSEMITGAALLCLIGAMLLMSDTSAHPGLPTLIPCVATAVIIHTGAFTRTLVGRLLSTRVVAFGGLISYSLYLWHWPLFVFVKYLDLQLTPATQLMLGILLLTLSMLSWKYIERPFRDPTSRLRKKALILLPSGLSIVLTSSAAVALSKGLPERYPENVAKIASYYDYSDRRDFRQGSCYLETRSGDFRLFDKQTCLKTSDTRPNYLLIGDSHAAHLWIGLSTVFPDLNFLQATASGCKPTLETGGETYCRELIDYALTEFLPATHIDGIIFSALWKAPDAAQLAATIEYCKKFVRKVIVLGPIPAHDVPLPNLIGRSLVENEPDLIFAHQSTYPQYIETMLEKSVHDAKYVSLLQLLCPENKCVVYASNAAPLQFDISHLTTEGSIFVATQLKRAGLFATIETSRARPDLLKPSDR